MSEYFDTCGLCNAPIRMGRFCACSDNWRADVPPATSAEPVVVSSDAWPYPTGVGEHRSAA